MWAQVADTVSPEALGGLVAGAIMTALSLLGFVAVVMLKAWPTLRKGWELLGKSASSAESSEKQLARLGGESLQATGDTGSAARLGEGGVLHQIIEDVIKRELAAKLEPAVEEALRTQLGPIQIAVTGISTAINALAENLRSTRTDLTKHADQAERRSRELSDRISLVDAERSTVSGRVPG